MKNLVRLGFAVVLGATCLFPAKASAYSPRQNRRELRPLHVLGQRRYRVQQRIDEEISDPRYSNHAKSLVAPVSAALN
jgi:hypothetical protein